MLIGIDLIIDGKPYGRRQWPAVPREGETVIVAKSDGVLEYRPVLQVQWGITLDSRKGFKGECEVALILGSPVALGRPT